MNAKKLIVALCCFCALGAQAQTAGTQKSVINNVPLELNQRFELFGRISSINPSSRTVAIDGVTYKFAPDIEIWLQYGTTLESVNALTELSQSMVGLQGGVKPMGDGTIHELCIVMSLNNNVGGR